MRRVGALLLATVVLLGACSSKSAKEVVVKASSATTDAKTARFSQTMDIQAGPGQTDLPAFESTGIVDFESGRLGLEMDVAGQKFEAVSNGTKIYVHMPMLAQELGGREWFTMSIGDIGKQAGIQGLGSLVQQQQQQATNNPASGLAMLQGAGDVTKVGTAKVRGQETTRYHAILDLDAALADAPADQKDTIGQIKQLLDTKTMPVDVWIDGDGLVRRYKQTITYAKATVPGALGDAPLPKSVTVTQEYWDFGTTVDLTIPKASEVVDFAELMQRAGQER